MVPILKYSNMNMRIIYYNIFSNETYLNLKVYLMTH